MRRCCGIGILMFEVLQYQFRRLSTFIIPSELPRIYEQGHVELYLNKIVTK